MGPTNPNFWQIKIITILILHTKTYFLLFIFLLWFFFLDYNKIYKKQKFGTLDIIESQSKEMWLVSYVTCVDIIA